MFCSKCGKQVSEQAKFCDFCGNELSTADSAQQPNNSYYSAPNNQSTYSQPSTPPPQYGSQPNSQQPYTGQQGAYYPPPTAPYGMPVQPITKVHMLINKLLTSSTFFALCVVYTVISAIDIVSSSGVDLVSILVVVFMWILRDSAFKQKPPTEIVKSFKVLNVVTTVCYVLVWVAVGCVTLGAFITLVSADFLSSVSLFDDVAYGVEAEIIELFLSGASWLGVLMIIIAVLLALYNVYFIGNCRKCAESFVRSCETGYSMFDKMDTVKKWFKALGIINIAIAAISVIGMFSLIPLVGFAVAIASLLSYGLNGALYLLFAKCFDEFEMSFYS